MSSFGILTQGRAEGQEMEVDKAELINDILEIYLKHGWQLRRVLLTPESRSQFDPTSLRVEAQLQESSIDAIWLSRPSHAGREAWELRLLAEQQFALFETFEKDETEEQREEMRSEMQARMRDYVSTGGLKASPS